MHSVNSKTESIISTFADLKIIFGGDWNHSINTMLDRWTNKCNTSNSYLLDFMNERYLIDIWTYKNPTVKEFAWRNRSGSLQSRIDHWSISDPLSESVSTVKM